MEKSITNDTVYDFLKLLVELGGLYYIDKDHVIIQNSNGEPVGVKTSSGKALPVALFKTGMSVNDNVVMLNPLVENLAKSGEREWFFNSLMALPGTLIKHTISEIIEQATSKKTDVEYAAMDVITEFMDKIDTKMIDEVDRIKNLEWGVIFYDSKEHTAQLQSDIFNEELEKKLKGKVRKASWEVFRGIMVMLLGTDHIEESYTHKATLIAIPRADAIFHVLIAAISKMSSIVKKATDIDLHPTLLKHHLANLEPYQKLMGWFSTGTAQASSKEVKEPTVPWKRSGVPGESSSVPGLAQSSSGVPKNAMPPGMLINPLMEQGGGVPGVSQSGVPIHQSALASYNGVPVIQSGYNPNQMITNPMMGGMIPAMGSCTTSLSGVPLNATNIPGMM